MIAWFGTDRHITLEILILLHSDVCYDKTAHHHEQRETDFIKVNTFFVKELILSSF
jgi:hypothetical protein